MITFTILFYLVGTCPHFSFSSRPKFAPVKITLNEHFNGGIPIPQSTAGVNGVPSFTTNFVHQGANFIFNPKLLISLGSIPDHIETLIAYIKETYNTSHTTEKNTVEVNIPEEPIQHTEGTTELPSSPTPLVPEIEQTICISEPIVIPDPPKLPPLSTTEIRFIEDTEKLDMYIDLKPPSELPEVPIINDEPTEKLPDMIEMPPAPELPPLELPEFPTHLNVEETLKPIHCIEETIHIEEEITPIVIPKPQKIFGILTSIPLISYVSTYIPITEKCNPCLEQELPIILPDILKPSSESSKIVLLLPAESKFPLVSNLPFDIVIKEKFNRGDEIVLPTVCAHNIIAERIVPNIMLSERSRKLFPSP